MTESYWQKNNWIVLAFWHDTRFHKCPVSISWYHSNNFFTSDTSIRAYPSSISSYHRFRQHGPRFRDRDVSLSAQRQRQSPNPPCRSRFLPTLTALYRDIEALYFAWWLLNARPISFTITSSRMILLYRHLKRSSAVSVLNPKGVERLGWHLVM